MYVEQFTGIVSIALKADLTANFSVCRWSQRMPT